MEGWNRLSGAIERIVKACGEIRGKWQNLDCAGSCNHWLRTRQIQTNDLSNNICVHEQPILLQSTCLLQVDFLIALFLVLVNIFPSWELWIKELPLSSFSSIYFSTNFYRHICYWCRYWHELFFSSFLFLLSWSHNWNTRLLLQNVGDISGWRCHPNAGYWLCSNSSSNLRICPGDEMSFLCCAWKQCNYLFFVIWADPAHSNKWLEL